MPRTREPDRLAFAKTPRRGGSVSIYSWREVIGRRWLERARPLVENVVAPMGQVVETFRAVLARRQILTVRQRVEVHDRARTSRC
jgi:hypothetical protein